MSNDDIVIEDLDKKEDNGITIPIMIVRIKEDSFISLYNNNTLH